METRVLENMRRDVTFPREGPQGKGWVSVLGGLQKSSGIPLRAEACQLCVVLFCGMEGESEGP